MRYADVCDAAGLTSRQQDYWRVRGWIYATVEGSGIPSEITRTEARVLVRMATLVTAGMKPQAAARIARATIEQGVRAADLPGNLRIVFDTNTFQEASTP